MSMGCETQTGRFYSIFILKNLIIFFGLRLTSIEKIPHWKSVFSVRLAGEKSI